MAARGKNEVELTFVGDEQDLKRAFDAVGQSSKQMEDQVQQSARDTAASLDRVGEAADTVDTRAMGFRDTLTGVQDSLAAVGVELSGGFHQSLLMAGFGLGDLGSGIYNFVAPSLKQLTADASKAKLALMGLGVAAAAAVVVGIAILGQQSRRTGNDLSEMSEDLERMVETGKETVLLKKLFEDTGKGLGDLHMQIRDASDGFTSFMANVSTFGGQIGDRSIDALNELDAAMAQLVDQGVDAELVIGRLAQTYNLSAAEVDKLRALLPKYGEAAERAKERTADLGEAHTEAAKSVAIQNRNLKELAETLLAQTDPVFGWIEAQRSVAEAQNAVNEAADKFGKNSPEYRDAVLDLAAAQLGLVSATAQVQGATDATLIPALQRLVAGGHLTKEAFNQLVAALDAAKAAVARLDGSTATINVIRRTIDETGNIPWGSIPQFHSGGVMPGAPGSEGLALLQAGETILPPGAGGGAPVVIQYNGGSGLGRWFLSELEELLRDNNLALVRR